MYKCDIKHQNTYGFKNLIFFKMISAFETILIKAKSATLGNDLLRADEKLIEK